MKYLLLAIIGILLVRYLLKLTKAHRPGQPEKREKRVEYLREDPVCGKYVPENRELCIRKGSQVFFFCSKACMETYKARSR